jgi:hypothetical protein
MPGNAELEQMAIRFWSYLEACASLPMSAPACRSLWEVVMYAAFALGVMLLFWVAWVFIDYRLKLRAALRAQAERERVADAETMAKHTWAEVADVADVTDPQLAEKIKRELDQRRISNISGRPAG